VPWPVSPERVTVLAMQHPLVAIVGAPNVGKSTLFNRILGRRRAIVTDEPGMTRDRLYGVVRDVTPPFRLVDTGGLTPNTEAPFAREIEQQAEVAISEAALILFVIDVRAGITALDRDLAAMLRRRNLTLLLLANKADSEKLASDVHDFHGLGLGPPIPISAEHGRGVDDLLDEIQRELAAFPQEPEEETPGNRWLNVSIVGRPNVGKSSLFNRLAGHERALVSDVPGTTRDAVDTLLEIDDKRYRLIDTAGLRRAGKIQRGPERFSVLRARRNLERADVAVLVIDADAGFAAQDAHVAGFVLDAYKPMVVAVNKWDLISDREAAAKRWEELVRRRLRFAKQVPLALISALSGQRVPRILDLADSVYAAAGIRVPTPELNRWLGRHASGNPESPPPRGQFRLFYVTQTAVHPPTFVLFCNDPSKAHFSMRRQIENSLRERFDFGPAPIRLQFRGRKDGAPRHSMSGAPGGPPDVEDREKA